MAKRALIFLCLYVGGILIGGATIADAVEFYFDNQTSCTVFAQGASETGVWTQAIKVLPNTEQAHDCIEGSTMDYVEVYVAPPAVIPGSSIVWLGKVILTDLGESGYHWYVLIEQMGVSIYHGTNIKGDYITGPVPFDHPEAFENCSTK